MTLGLVSVVVAFVVGAFGGVRMPAHVWLCAGLAAWLGSLVFAAFGLFMGYLLPSENVMQILGPVLAVLSLFGGLFVPLEVQPHICDDRQVHPGVRRRRDRPLPADRHRLQLAAVVNVVVWTAVFGVGAALAVPARHRPGLSRRPAA